MYSSGEGVTEDDTKALNWFKRAAEAGNVSGMVSLGGIYLLGGSGTDPNEEEAARWFRRPPTMTAPRRCTIWRCFMKAAEAYKELRQGERFVPESGSLGQSRSPETFGETGRGG